MYYRFLIIIYLKEINIYYIFMIFHICTMFMIHIWFIDNSFHPEGEDQSGSAVVENFIKQAKFPISDLSTPVSKKNNRYHSSQMKCLLLSILVAVATAHDYNLPINPELGVPGFPDCVQKHNQNG